MTTRDQDNNTESEPDPKPVDPVSYQDIDSQMGEFERNVAVNERLLQLLREYELLLLEAASLPALLHVLLRASRAQFDLLDVTLCLYDPQDLLAELLPEDLDYSSSLHLTRDSFEMHELYGVDPEVEVLGPEDPRIARVMSPVDELSSLLILPLTHEGGIVGSLHMASARSNNLGSVIEMDFMSHLAAIISICLENCINAERLSHLSLLDPLTRVGNTRSFGMELRKEISRAQRNQKSLSLLFVRVDDFKSITEHYGHLSGDHVLRTVSASLAEMLRHTDLIARCEPDVFGILLPACSEVKGQELSERMRSETEFMEIDDRRGAHLFASLGVGMTCWNPQTYPAVNMEQLAQQMLSSARAALARASDAGGNRVAVTRLTTMIV